MSFIDGMKVEKNALGEPVAAPVSFTEATFKQMLYAEFIRVVAVVMYTLGFFIAPIVWGVFKLKKLFARFF